MFRSGSKVSGPGGLTALIGWLAIAPAVAQAPSIDDAKHVLRRIALAHRSAWETDLVGGVKSVAQLVGEQIQLTIPENPLVAQLLQPLQLPATLGATGNLSHLRWAQLVYAYTSDRQLNEVMTQFWENHFNTQFEQLVPYLVGKFPTLSPSQIQDYQCWLEWQGNQMFRANALGTFRDLLRNVTKSPSMMIYLNMVGNADCVQPNQNYAREFLELYSMSNQHQGTLAANYTEADVAVISRIFTGWDLDSALVPQPTLNHCPGPFTVFANQPHQFQWNGVDANTDLLALVDHVAQCEPTRDFICRKLLRVFLGDDAGTVETTLLANAKLAWGTTGDLKAVLSTILGSTAFTGTAWRWTRARMPLEKAVWLPSVFDADLVALVSTPAAPTPLKLALPDFRTRTMGHSLFQVPPPIGFPIASLKQLSTHVSLTSINQSLDGLRWLPAFFGDLMPTINIGAVVLLDPSLSAADKASPTVMADWLLRRMFGSAGVGYSTADRDLVRDALAKDETGATQPLVPPVSLGDPALLAYDLRLLIGVAVAGTFHQTSMK